ncbi:hypothetical protein [Corallococcus macrosporus]|uniref:Lipoprotein n=1 Tax=Corallococcus macrosporus DSM 14697 TaxID=1189310 RepID=A0A250JNL9_9BACT|nr:hypothetical protein [Corallococcus macrosporus]ATB45087.1 hypothetical protein MYMAC_000671 [Corallococcus macrosporus DSM 14697]
MRIQAVVLAVLLMACGDSGGEPDENAFLALFEVSYGNCAGVCYARLDVASDGAAQVSYAERKGRLETKRPFLLWQSELDGLLEDVALSRTEAWESQYGCPECVDQGQYFLKLAGTDGVRQATVDPNVIPEHLAPLIGRLDEVLVRGLR